jgi:hypothetical protein
MTSGNNWSPSAPTSADTAKFDSTVGNFAPVLGAVPGSNQLFCNKLEITSNWSTTITINGTLTAYSSDLHGSSNFEGAGTFDVESATGDFGSSVNHTWAGPNVNVTAINVQAGAHVLFTAGRLGSGGPSGGLVHIQGTGGASYNATLEVQGAHTLGSKIEIESQGHLVVSDDASFTNTGSASKSTTNLRLVENLGGEMRVVENKGLALNGAAYWQYDPSSWMASTTKLEPFSSLSIGDNYDYMNGSRSDSSNILVAQGTVDAYLGSSLSTTDGAQSYWKSTFNIRAPGYYNAGTQGIVSVDAGYVVHGYGSPATSDITFYGTSDHHQSINFLNYTYGEIDQDSGAKLYTSSGRVVLSGYTDLVTRLLMGGTAGGFDYIDAVKSNLDGTHLTLTINTTYATGNPNPYIMYKVIKSATNAYTKTNNGGNPFSSVTTPGLTTTSITQTTSSPADGVDISLAY